MIGRFVSVQHVLHRVRHRPLTLLDIDLSPTSHLQSPTFYIYFLNL